MVRVRQTPHRIDGASGQPVRMRFGEYDRIVIDDIDWRCLETNEDGHLFQAEHDGKIRRGYSHEQMQVEAGKAGFRHDRNWYSKGTMKARLRADVSSLSELDYPVRQLIMWKEDFVLEFLRLEQTDPTVTRGDDPLKKAIARVDTTLRERQSATSDNGRRRRSGRLKMFFDPPGPKAFLEWVKLYVGADRDPLVFRPRTYKSGNREERLSDEQAPISAKYAFRFASPTKPTRYGLWRAMKAEIEDVLNPAREQAGKEPIPVPSYGRLCREIEMMDEFEKEAGREGIEYALKLFRPQGDGMQDVLRPLQQVEIDHWDVGLKTILIQSRAWERLTRAARRKLEKVRMVLGVAICRRTHCVLGMTLSRTASVEAAIRLLEISVSDKSHFARAAGSITPYDIFGTPEMLFMDGGPAFDNHEFRAVLRDLEVDFEIPPSGLPHLRGMVERMFRSIDEQLLIWFEGRTFSDVVEKGDYDSAARAGTTVEELGRVLVRFAVDCHHNQPQAALGGETPRQCYLRLTKEHGVRPSPDSHKLRNVFGIDIKRTLTAGGIRFLNVQYRSRTLHEQFVKLGNIELDCRVYPANIGAISVKIGKSFLTVSGPKEFDRVDAETWIGAEAELRKKAAHMKKHVTGPIINAAIQEFERVAEIGRKRADISDNPIQRKTLLAAEREMRIFADYPDEEDTAQNPPGDLYGSTIKVGVPEPRRKTTNAPRRPQAGSTPPPSKPPKPPKKTGRTSKRVPGRPAGRRNWRMED